jgi:PAS domain S-box-containing protein
MTAFDHGKYVAAGQGIEQRLVGLHVLAPAQLLPPPAQQLLAGIADHLAVAVVAPQETAVQIRFHHADDTLVWVNVSGAVIRDSAGQAVSTLGVALDITERKQWEERLRASE